MLVQLMGNTSSHSSSRGTPTPTPDTPTRSRSRSQHPQNHRIAPLPPTSAHHSPARAGDAQQLSADDKSLTSQKRLPHRSLRTKKKSLELPDLALALTPPVPPGAAGSGVSGPYRRPQASSPIAIPTRSSQNGAPVPDEPRLKTIPTAYDNVNGQPPPIAEVIVQPANGRGRGHSHMRGGPLPYNSTHSFTGTGRGQPLPSFVLRTQAAGQFAPEDIHSSIPLALRKAEPSGATEERDREEEILRHDAKRDSAEGTEPAQVCIVWRGGGKSVFLVRAGDNNWKGRQPMEFDEVKNQWSAWVPLLPGTHHIRFLVDGVSTIAEDLPTTVDDNGSLANYVSVPFSSISTITTIASIQQTPKEQQILAPPSGTGQSFFADAEAQGGQEDGAWTDKVPWQLECAAEEEEQWLNHTHSHAHNQHQIPPPQHPQAPSLPRHLEKLIMNQKPPTTRTSSKPGGSSTALFGGRDTLPVTTASGTNLSATTSAGLAGSRARNAPSSSRDGYIKMGDAPAGIHAGLGLADDGSVLPVPNHVVLHHLGTSAIRNGVLAVADTLRYRKKYITTIYYKPT